MNDLELPSLPNGVEYLGRPDGPDESMETDGGIQFTVLWARYRSGGLSVNIGWTVNHLMGDFRDPNRLVIDFDSSDHAAAVSDGEGYNPEQALQGITTSILRSIPMAHARALMRPRHEQLSVAGLRESLSPLPNRVESEKDYVHIAMAYIALVNGSSVEPLRRLSEWTHESAETWSARLRRARARGILIGKGRDAQLSPAYQETANSIWRELSPQRGEPDGHK